MRLKVICTRPSQPFLETVSGDEASPRPVAGPDGDALPPICGGAGARQPGETASPLSRATPAGPESAICWKNFAVLKSLFSSAELSAKVSFCLLNMDLHLLQIAQSRARQEFGRVTSEAHAVGLIARNLGAGRAATAAQLLEQACRDGDYTATCHLLSELSQSCDEAGRALKEWLPLNSAAPER